MTSGIFGESEASNGAVYAMGTELRSEKKASLERRKIARKLIGKQDETIVT